MKLVNRKSWGSVSVSGIPTNITPEFGGIAIHYVGGSGKIQSMPHSKCANIVRRIQHDHIHGNGWVDIAYNFLVCPHGYVFEGRGLNKRSAANGNTSGNQYYYAVCGLINEGETPTDEMLKAIKEACQYLRTKGHAADKVLGHKNLTSTSCPGPLYTFVQKGTFARPSVSEDNSYPGYLIKLGSTGPLVGKIQNRLNVLVKSTLRIDRDFGAETEKAVKKLQKQAKLSVDGIVGRKTWEELF